VGASGRKTLLGQARELLDRDLRLARVAAHSAPTHRHPQSGRRQVGRSRVPACFRHRRRTGGVRHFWAAAPFAHVITTPTAPTRTTGGGTSGTRATKQSATCTRTISPGTRVPRGPRRQPRERFFSCGSWPWSPATTLARAASRPRVKHGIVARLRACGRVFVSTEGPLPDELRTSPSRSPDRMHDAVASPISSRRQPDDGGGGRVAGHSEPARLLLGRAPLVPERARAALRVTFAYLPRQADALLATSTAGWPIRDCALARRQHRRCWRRR
jgi:hypothetical protein